MKGDVGLFAAENGDVGLFAFRPGDAGFFCLAGDVGLFAFPGRESATLVFLNPLGDVGLFRALRKDQRRGWGGDSRASRLYQEGDAGLFGLAGDVGLFAFPGRDPATLVFSRSGRSTLVFFASPATSVFFAGGS